LEAALLLTPAAIALHGGLRLLARRREALTLCRLHLTLAQLQHHLLCAWLLASPHVRLLWSWLILSISPVRRQLVRSSPQELLNWTFRIHHTLFAYWSAALQTSIDKFGQAYILKTYQR
jgi:hypothetical protein